jgi:hypothetical protein
MDPILVDVSKPRRGWLPGPSRSRPGHEWLMALIKEAHARARRRRRRIAAGLSVAAIVGLGIAFGGLFNNGGGGGAAAARQPSLPVRETAAPGPVANGPLTLFANDHAPYPREQIAAVGAFGATGTVFRCSYMNGCREMTAFAWSPNGRWLAIAADTVSVASNYNGLHLYNLATKRDIRLAWGHVTQLSWSRDGSKLAYVVAGLVSDSRGRDQRRDGNPIGYVCHGSRRRPPSAGDARGRAGRVGDRVTRLAAPPEALEPLP